EALDEVEEGEPLVAVFVLAGPATRGVEDHALARHPPVAVARAAEAAHATARRRQVRELEARVAQRGALSAAGRADDRVPGQRVEGLLAALLAGLERRDGLLELGPHLGDLVLEVGARR